MYIRTYVAFKEVVSDFSTKVRWEAEQGFSYLNARLLFLSLCLPLDHNGGLYASLPNPRARGMAKT